MASPPAKKQKRLIVLSSEKDEADHESWRATSSKSQRSIGTTGSVRKSKGRSSATLLPARARTKTKPFARIQTLPSSGKLIPDSSSNKPDRKSLEAGTINTFFNNATAQQADGAAKAAKASSQQDEEEDLIEDDSLDEVLISRFSAQKELQYAGLSQSWARKISAETSLSNGNRPHALQRFLPADKTELPQASHAGPARLEGTKPWAEMFGPTRLEELAVHKKKVADVGSWLSNVMDGKDRKRLLVLKGPSGTGKTITISILTKAMDVDIVEWKNPLGSEYASEAFRSLSAQFEEFLERSGKFNSLAMQELAPPISASNSPTPLAGQPRRKKAILLEELPNTFSRTSHALSSFRSCVLQYLAASTPSTEGISKRKQEDQVNVTPLIMIISETLLTTVTASTDSFTAHGLLGSDILNHTGTTMIEFNPIAPTYIIKALQLVTQKEARRSGRCTTPGPAVLKKLSHIGDVRSAIASLEFMCLGGDDSGDWGGRVASVVTKGAKGPSAMTKMEQKSIAIVTQREATLDIFHAVGRVVYNKREEIPAADPQMEPPIQPPDHLSEFARPMISLVNVDELMDETGTDTPTFVAALHENYVTSCNGPTSIDALNGCLEALSDSDLLGSDRRGGFCLREGSSNRIHQGSDSESLRQNEICFQVAVRGILFALPYPIKRQILPVGGKGDTPKIFYPTSLRLWKRTEELEGLLDCWMDPYMSASRAQPEHFTRFSKGVHMWTLRSSDSVTNPPPQAARDFSPTLPLFVGGYSARNEMILERLPYIAMIECRRPNTRRRCELERMTRFRGIGGRTDQEPDDFDAVRTDSSAAPAARSQARSGGVPGTNEKKSQVEGLTRGFTTSEAREADKMVLSDDDIEDD